MKLADAFTGPEQKRRYVRSLFATIADRYDLITVALSFGRDRAWKRRLVEEAALQPGDRVLDLACGTGDIAIAASQTAGSVLGLDVTLRMIEIANGKKQAMAPRRTAAMRFIVGDMMALPLAPASVDVITTGYGLRNVPQLAGAIDEIARVLRPGGRFLSLDFNRPEVTPIRWVYLTYLTLIGSTLGWILHRDPDTYRYIPESLRRYPGARGVADLLSRAGFTQIRILPVLGGLMTIHAARRPGVPTQ